MIHMDNSPAWIFQLQGGGFRERMAFVLIRHFRYHFAALILTEFVRASNFILDTPLLMDKVRHAN